jgi:Fe-S-cluster-containing dehydrogenase component
MKKCTLCIDRIYNESMDEADRIPACVAVCPTRARHFGDLGDPDSDVSRLVAERGGHGLMPELGYGTVNRYLPPRARTTGVSRDEVVAASRPAAPEPAPDLGGHPFLRWVDRLLSAA